VLIALQTTVGDVQTLMPSVSSGVSATLSSQMTTSTPLSVANSQNIAVADPTPAPYGDAAYMIMHDMGLWPTKGTVPTGVHSPLYGNITLTFNSVTDTTNKSGFVSKSQICAGIAPHHASPPDYIYIAFTHSSYMRVQKGILFDSGDGTQNALGSSLKDYMLSNSDPNFWPNFLDAHCYAPI
jgi:molybdate transport system substrate-binding protein